MRMKVVIESEEDFEKWLSEQKVFYTNNINQPIKESADAEGLPRSEEVREDKTTI